MIGNNYLEKRIFDQEKFVFVPDSTTELLIGKRKENADISIVIPTYKRNNTLYEAVKSAIEQDCTVEYEVLIIDNNDDDTDTSTLNMLNDRFPCVDFCYYKNKKNLGMTGNWNIAIQLAHGKYIVILHDDDRLHKDYLSVIRKIIFNNPEIGVITCLHDEISDDYVEYNNSDRKINTITYRVETVLSSFLHHTMHVCGMCFCREKAIEIGGFDDYWYPGADYVFEIKLLEKYGGVLCKHKLTDYRISENESLKPQVSGRFPIIIYIGQTELNSQHHILPHKIALSYEKMYLYRYEELIKQQWCRNVDDEQELIKEFEYWHTLLGISKVNNWDVMVYKCLRYILKPYHYIHTHRIHESKGINNA